VKPAKILHRLNLQYGEGTLPYESACELYNKFSEGQKEVSNLPHAYNQPIDAYGMNILGVEELF
jgi:hypothetical protein